MHTTPPPTPTPKPPTLWDVFWEKVDNRPLYQPTDRFTLTDKGREAICGSLNVSVSPKG